MIHGFLNPAVQSASESKSSPMGRGEREGSLLALGTLGAPATTSLLSAYQPSSGDRKADSDIWAVCGLTVVSHQLWEDTARK